MSPERFRACIAAVHWTGRGLADILQMDERQLRRWASGDYPVPDQIAEWLERVARFHERNPPPARPARDRPGELRSLG